MTDAMSETARAREIETLPVSISPPSVLWHVVLDRAGVCTYHALAFLSAGEAEEVARVYRAQGEEDVVVSVLGVGVMPGQVLQVHAGDFPALSHLLRWEQDRSRLLRRSQRRAVTEARHLGLDAVSDPPSDQAIHRALHAGASVHPTGQ